MCRTRSQTRVVRGSPRSNCGVFVCRAPGCARSGAGAGQFRHHYGPRTPEILPFILAHIPLPRYRLSVAGKRIPIRNGGQAVIHVGVVLDDGYRAWNGGCFPEVNRLQRRPYL